MSVWGTAMIGVNGIAAVLALFDRTWMADTRGMVVVQSVPVLLWASVVVARHGRRCGWL